MNQENKFLTELDDYELAYFAKYRLPTYLPESQTDIKKYLAKKGLTDSKVEQLVSVKPKRQSKKGQQRCPRCSSDKIRTEKAEAICNVCGFYVPEAKNKKQKSFSRRVLDTIVGYIDGVISGI